MELKLWTSTEEITHGGISAPYTFSAKEVLLSLIPKVNPVASYTLNDIRLRMKMLDILEDATEDMEIELSKEMCALLVRLMDGVQFTIASEELIKLYDLLKKGADG